MNITIITDGAYCPPNVKLGALFERISFSRFSRLFFNLFLSANIFSVCCLFLNISSSAIPKSDIINCTLFKFTSPLIVKNP